MCDTICKKYNVYLSFCLANLVGKNPGSETTFSRTTLIKTKWSPQTSLNKLHNTHVVYLII